MKQAIKLIESGDRLMGHGRFLPAMIDWWAYEQLGLYKPATSFTDEQESVAKDLSKEIRRLMERHIGEDVIGHLWCETIGAGGFGQYFPTPNSLSRFMSELVGGRQLGLTDFLDCCSGTGSITLSHIYQTFLSEGVGGVAKLNIHMEELDGTKLKASVIQLVNLLDILGEHKPLHVHSLHAYQMNSLSREQLGVKYIFSGINNRACKLSEEQKSLIQHALDFGYSPDVISTQLRVPFSLVLREQQGQLIA